MINGLQFDFSSAELVEHFAAREVHHVEKVRFYRGQADSLSAGREESSGVTNDPVASLRNSLRQHARQADYFHLLAAHIIPGETYRLNESDLGKAEFISALY